MIEQHNAMLTCERSIAEVCPSLFFLLYRVFKCEGFEMLLIATTQTKVRADLEQMLADGFLDVKTISDLGDQAEAAAEALNDLYEQLHFAMPEARNEEAKKYSEFGELAFEMLEYHAAVVDAMLALKRQAHAVAKSANNEQLRQAV